MNSSESPGRKKPISSPVSANITTPTPSTPKAASRDWALRTFTASSDPSCDPSCDAANKGAAIAGSPLILDGRAQP